MLAVPCEITVGALGGVEGNLASSFFNIVLDASELSNNRAICCFGIGDDLPLESKFVLPIGCQ